MSDENQLVCYFLSKKEFQTIRSELDPNQRNLEEIVQKLSAQEIEDRPLLDGGIGKLTLKYEGKFVSGLSNQITKYFNGENPHLGYVIDDGMVANGANIILGYVDHSMLEAYESVKDNSCVFIKLDSIAADIIELNDM